MRVPLVVLTGFLGSGKTTLLNRLLARRIRAAGHLGVIVNELGEVDIDGALLDAQRGTSRQVNLPGGCVCCVMGDELDRTLVELVDANPELAAIVLETTGVAEPLPIAWAASRPPASERVRLAAVVTLVDAENFRASRRVSGAVDAQVAYADVVLVTKGDNASVVSEIRTLAPRAMVRTGSTDEHAAWLDNLLADPPMSEPPPEHVHGPDCDHDHDHGIDTAWIPAPGTFDLEELEDQLADLPGNYVRIKGIVEAVDARGGTPVRSWVAIHRVGLRVSSEPIGNPRIPEGRLVALGPNVDRETLAEHASRAIVTP